MHIYVYIILKYSFSRYLLALYTGDIITKESDIIELTYLSGEKSNEPNK